MNKAHAILMLIASMISLTAGASLAKTLFAAGGASGTSVVRIGFGAILLGVAFRPWRLRITFSELRSIALYGICLGLMNLLFYHAIARLPVGLAIAIEFLGPLSVALAHSRKKIDFVWAFTAMAGVLLVVPRGGLTSQGVSGTGIAFALAAAVAWALYIIIGKRAGRVAPPGMVTSLGMSIGFLTILPFGYASAYTLVSDVNRLPLLLAVGLLSSAIPYSLEIVALKQLPEKHFSLLLSLEPAIGALMALLILGETLTAVQCVAVVLVMVASLGPLTGPPNFAWLRRLP